MKLNDSFGKRFAAFLSQSCLAVLLTAFAFSLGMTGCKTADAATVTDTVFPQQIDDTVKNKEFIKMTVNIENVDLAAYAKYTEELHKIDKYKKKTIVFAKAAPGTQVTFTVITGYPDINLGYTSDVNFYEPRIEENKITFGKKKQHFGGFDDINTSTMKGSRHNATGSYTIPKDVEMVDADCSILYILRPKNVTIARRYYIFTSDEAFKKAYKAMTGNTISGPIASSDAKKEPVKPSAGKQADGKQPPKDDDDGTDWGTIGKISIGIGAAGAIGFGATKLFSGGAGAGTNATDASGAYPQYPQHPQFPQYPQEPESFVYTDPSGVQTLYERDPNTGEWFNPSTGGIVDMNDLERFSRQRATDQAWIHDQTNNMIEHKTDIDRTWQQQDQEAAQKMQQTFDEIDRQGAKDRVAIKSGTYGMSDAQRIERQKSWQSMLEADQKASHRLLNLYDGATKTLEVTEKAADIAVDGLSVITEPVGGKLVADVYSGVKNIGKSTMEAVAEGKSIIGGIGEGFTKGAADIIQNHAGGSWKAKVGTFVGSETGKEVIVAAIKGEDTAKAAIKGASNGLFKYAVSEIGDNISAGAGQQNSNAMTQHYKEINRMWNKDLSQKSINKLTSMNFQKYFGKETTRELAQGFGQSITKEIGATTYDGVAEGKSVTESLFDDKW